MTSAFALRSGRFDRAHPGRARQFGQPGRPGFWVYVVLVVVATALLVWGMATTLGHPAVWLAAGIWLVWTSLVYWLFCRADLMEVVPSGVRIASVVWGVVCLMYSGPLDGWIERRFPITGAWSDAIYAPLPEDGLKLLGVVLIATVVPHVLRRRMGAVLVGLLVGLGFTAVENWIKANAVIVGGDMSDLPTLMLTRATVGLQAHSLFAAVAAVGVWYVLAHPRRPLGSRLLVAVGCFLSGMVLHAATDAPFNTAGIVAVQVVQIALLFALIFWARRGERAWVIQTTMDGRAPITTDEGRVLASRRARRAARHQAQPNGHDAVSAVTNRHHTELAYLNAVDANTDHETLDRIRRQLITN